MRAITLSDGIQPVTVTTNSIVALEDMGYDPFTAYTLVAVLKDDIAVGDSGDDGKVTIDPHAVSLAKVRDHLAAALDVSPSEIGSRMIPSEFGNYLIAVIELGLEFWGAGEDGPKEDDSTSGE